MVAKSIAKQIILYTSRQTIGDGRLSPSPNHGTLGCPIVMMMMMMIVDLNNTRG